jgi:hypothetical protein
MKAYEFRFASASTSSNAPNGLRPPSDEPGWSIHSWQADVTITKSKPAGPGMHAPATLGNTYAQILVLWEREVADVPLDAGAEPAAEKE